MKTKQQRDALREQSCQKPVAIGNGKALAVYKRHPWQAVAELCDDLEAREAEIANLRKLLAKAGAYVDDTFLSNDIKRALAS